MGQLWFGFLERLGIAFTGSPEGSTIPVELMKRKRDKQPGTTDSPIPGKIPRSVSVRKNGKHEEDIEPEEWENESFYDGMNCFGYLSWKNKSVDKRSK